MAVFRKSAFQRGYVNGQLRQPLLGVRREEFKVESAELRVHCRSPRWISFAKLLAGSALYYTAGVKGMAI